MQVGADIEPRGEMRSQIGGGSEPRRLPSGSSAARISCQRELAGSALFVVPAHPRLEIEMQRWPRICQTSEPPSSRCESSMPPTKQVPVARAPDVQDRGTHDLQRMQASTPDTTVQQTVTETCRQGKRGAPAAS